MIEANFWWFRGTLKSLQFWIGVAIPIISFLIITIILRRRNFLVSTVTLSLPFKLGNITYKATEQDRVFAWKLYVHLKTRKAALPFDGENDVIAEVYDSLYELFQITRDLLCSIPVEYLQGRRNIADLILRVQNDGLRPHLTKWQAPFRRWWMKAIESPDNQEKSPQEIQRQYKSYDALVSDLQQMNTEVSKFAEELLRIVHSEKLSFLKKLLIRWKSQKILSQPPSLSPKQSTDLSDECEKLPIEE
jgi:hypothetical protein